MADVLAFWAVLLVVGALALPFAFRLFRRFPDGGAGLAFALGITLLGTGYFLLRVGRVLPQGRGGVLLALALLALVAVIVAARDRRFAATLRRVRPEIALVAGLFSIAFFGFVAFRSYTADIAHTEQPMDFLYLNAALTSPEYPPHDPWLAGEQASYYYGGYVQAAVLTSAAGIPASVGYNLALGAVFASAAAAIASLAAALARWLLRPRALKWSLAAAGLAAGLLLVAGSLTGPFELAAAHDAGQEGVYEAFGVEALLTCGPGETEACIPAGPDGRTSSWYPTEFWFWWRATRLIPNTITEFPAFSFLLGDLHPHVMAIPGTLLALAFAAALWRGWGPLDWRAHRQAPLQGVLLAVAFGALAFVNVWDVITFSAALALAVLVRNLRALPPLPAALATLRYLALPALAAGALYAPWYVDFRSQASGLYAYTREGTEPAHALLTFGAPVLAGLAVCVWLARRRFTGPLAAVAPLSLWAPLIPLLVWILLAAARGDLGDGVDGRGASGWATLASEALLVWALTSAFFVFAQRRHPATPVAGLAALGVLLLYGSELLFIRDVFFDGAPRLNTVFKLSYQAWILLSVAGGVALAGAFARLAASRAGTLALAAPAAVLLGAAAVYTVTAVPNRSEGFEARTAIDGLAYVARNDAAEYELVEWLRANVAGDAVVVEATGRTWRRNADGQPEQTGASIDYTDAGRVSARTGLQTPIGWYGHEIQWRGDNPGNHTRFSRRQDLVDRVYTTNEPVALDALRELGADYVVVGRVERSRYVGDLMPPFETFLDLVFDGGDTAVYALPVFDAVETS